MTTEAEMVLSALRGRVTQDVIGLGAGLPDDHVAAAVDELEELVLEMELLHPMGLLEALG